MKTNFSLRNHGDQKEVIHHFQALKKKKKWQPRVLYQFKISFRNGNEINIFQIKKMYENVLPGNSGNLEYQKGIKYNKKKSKNR